MSSYEPKSCLVNGSRLNLLPANFAPSIHEVIIGRGRSVTSHCGNIRLQEIIVDCLAEYSAASTKNQKSAIIRRVVDDFKDASPLGAGFVKRDTATKRWYIVDDMGCRCTVAQAFRDALAGKYKSSRQFKAQRRMNMKKQAPVVDTTKANEVVKSLDTSNPFVADLASGTSTKTIGSVLDQLLDSNKALFNELEAPSSFNPFSFGSELFGRNLDLTRGLKCSVLDQVLENKPLLADSRAPSMSTRFAGLGPCSKTSRQLSEGSVLLGRLVDNLDVTVDVDSASNPFEPIPLSQEPSDASGVEPLRVPSSKATGEELLGRTLLNAFRASYF